MSPSPLRPPVPFADFEFTFDPSLSSIFPNPHPMPSSADLFSPDETTDLLGFLDNFGDLGWDSLNAPAQDSYDHNALHESPQHHHPQAHHHHQAPYSNPHLHTAPEQSTSTRTKSARRGRSTPPSSTSASASTPTPGRASSPSTAAATANDPDLTPASSAARTKSLLSTPQKRLNHIMSEQKRRNAIRDGYAQLIALMAPAGAAPGLGMPTRGRPKGSGSRGKGESKGKSGVLFRAVEYCRWLEEGRAALREEVARVEKAVAALGLRG